MIRLRSFEGDGLAVAAMSDRTDGGCGFDDPSDNRSGFVAKLGASPSKLTCAKQVHGTRVVVVDADSVGQGATSRESAIQDADALVTNIPGVPIGIHIADCTPIWLYGPTTRSLGMAHAGWRGTQSNIVARVVDSMQTTYGADPSTLRAYIGPCAGPEAYETSPQIALEFSHSRGRCLDLATENRANLVAAGVSESSISVARLCTISGGRFYSYRGGDRLARNLALGIIAPV